MAPQFYDGPQGDDNGLFLWLLPQHRDKLRSSGISEQVALERGYESVTGEARLIGLGFAPYQCRLPGLLIPIRNGVGKVIAYQYRPDEPRLGQRRNGKLRPVKYETPTGSKHRLDAPPGVRPALKDPTVPLVLTEGPIKADSAVSAGYPALAVAGVWAWSGPVARDDLRCVTWEGREVLVVFDSDAAENPSVFKAELALTTYLGTLGATARSTSVPSKADGSKQGLDDFLAAGGRLRPGGC